MRRARLPINAVYPWCRLNGVTLDGVTITDLENGQGNGLIATSSRDSEDSVFIHVPRDLVLCEELVWEQAKSDPYLRQVLEAVGEWAKTPKGAIIVFLLVQLTASSPDVHEKIGTANPFSDYVQFLPDEMGLPSRWSDAELECLWGTTLQNHMRVKMAALQRQFDQLREATISIPWCEKWWWSEDHGVLTIDDLKAADAMFRSRAMDFGDSGLSLVPIMDMANHDHESSNIARYEIDSATRGALLPLQWGRYVERGYEVTINYGSDRSASDMLHSYGFIEESMDHAGSMFVSLPPFEDDPLARAKMVALELVPGVKFGVDKSDLIEFHSPCLWAMVVNEEDGLRIELARTTDGEQELQVHFKDTHIRSEEELQSVLQEDLLWDLFNLRAHQYLVNILEDCICRINNLRRRPLGDRLPEGVSVESHAWKMSENLRDLEYKLLVLATAEFRQRAQALMGSDAVRRWFDGEFETSNEESTLSLPPLTSQPSYEKRMSRHRIEGAGAESPENIEEDGVHQTGWTREEVSEQDDWDYVSSQTYGLETASHHEPPKASEGPADDVEGWETVSKPADSAGKEPSADVDASIHRLPDFLGRMQFSEDDSSRLSRKLLGSEAKEKSRSSSDEERHVVEKHQSEGVEEEDDFS